MLEEFPILHAMQGVEIGTGLTAWITIGADETVTLQVPISEMGQGTMTGLAQVMADELRVAWAQIKVVHAPVDAAHGGTNAGPWGRFTGGSLGLRHGAACVPFEPGYALGIHARQGIVVFCGGFMLQLGKARFTQHGFCAPGIGFRTQIEKVEHGTPPEPPGAAKPVSPLCGVVQVRVSDAGASGCSPPGQAACG